MNEIIDCLVHGIKVGEKYPPSVRAFCISLHGTSPKAYNYVRHKFAKNIPHPETIREWYRNSQLDAASGITQHSLNCLEKLAKDMANEGKQLVVALLMDEVAIKRNMIWDRSKNKFIGLIDCGENLSGEFTLADYAIVFMVSGLNVYFLIAYYFIKTLKGPDRAKLVLHIVAELSKRGIKVKNLTFDGYAGNELMSEILGADFKAKDGMYVTYFKNPHDQTKVYLMYDASHMLKLVRNTLGSVETLFVGEEKVEWKYFVELVNISKQQNFGLAHKMNKRHIDWKNRMMHVRTAIETLSASTANSMEFLMTNGIPEFKNAAATIKFVRIWNSVWDIMNSTRIKTNEKNVYKSAINPTNKNEIFVFLNEAKNYILSLKIMQPKSGNIVQLVKSTHRTGFRGLIIDIISLTAIYFELVEDHHWLIFFATYRVSQDHIEMMFGKIRSLNGQNDNPMPHQFVSAYRKILHQCEVTHSPYSNVSALANSTVGLISSDILTVPSFMKNRLKLTEQQTSFSSFENPTSEIQSSLIASHETLDWEQLIQTEYLTDNVQDSGIVFAAKSIESRLTNCEQIYCNPCVEILRNSPKINDHVCVNLETAPPCISTYKICKLTDTVVKIYINSGQQIKLKTYLEVMNGLEWHNIFPEFDLYNHDIEHKHFIVKFIIDEYVNKKCSYYAKQTMLDLEKEYVRSKLRKIVHAHHQ